MPYDEVIDLSLSLGKSRGTYARRYNGMVVGDFGVVKDLLALANGATIQ